MHLREAHPRCDFCKSRFFDGDALYDHMRAQHATCHVCETSGARHRYFADSGALWHHIASEHHACDEAECAANFIAFASAEQLRLHHITAHTSRMLPMDRSRTYRLEVEPAYMQRRAHRAPPEPPRPASPPPVAAQRRRRAPRANAVAADAPPPGVAEQAGFVLYDDAAGTAQGLRAGAVPAAAVLGGMQTARAPTEASFPPLAAGAAPAPRAAAPPVEAPARPPPLVRKQVSCACGLTKRWIVVQASEEPGTLECQAACAAHRRKLQLADAFGRDADSPPSFLSSREVQWSSELVLVRFATLWHQCCHKHSCSRQ